MNFTNARSDRGATAVEYAMIVAGMAVALLVAACSPETPKPSTQNDPTTDPCSMAWRRALTSTRGEVSR